MNGPGGVVVVGLCWGLLLAAGLDRLATRLAVGRSLLVGRPAGHPAGFADHLALRLAAAWLGLARLGPAQLVRFAAASLGLVPLGSAPLANAPLSVAPLAAARLAATGQRGAGWSGAAGLQGRREARRRERAVVEQLPDVVDLLRLTTSAGLPVAAAVVAIGDRPGGPVGRALRSAAVRLHRGATTADVVAQLVDACGPSIRSLVDALLDHDRYGTPLGPALDRLAVESRSRRRRQGEEAARRLPVLLLFPLVLTTLPAFLLLAIVPLLAGSFSSLRL